MKNRFNFIAAPAVLFCWCFFLLQGCKKDPVIEDTTLLTNDDNLSLAKDTLQTKVFSEFEDPLVSNGISNGVLGTLTDPDFGTTYAGFYVQHLLTGNNIYFGENRVIDSAVLTLEYYGQYGKFTQSQTVNVYELNESMVDSVAYNTNRTFGFNNNPIGTKSGFIPDFDKDTLTVLDVTFPPHLRVRLSNSFGQRILDADTGTILRDNASFLNEFKGLYVTTASSTTGDGVTYLDLSSRYSAVTLYYHNHIDTPLYYTLPLSGVRVNHFEHYYTGALTASVNTPNVNGEEKMYLQAGAGVKGKIFINGLDSLPKSIAVNKAEIVLTQAAGSTYVAPKFLFLYRIDDVGQAQAIEDGTLLGLVAEGKEETVNGVTLYRYRFNFKNYFQKLLQGVYNNNGFYVKTNVPNSNTERVVIANSSTDENYKLTLVVTYTKL